MPTWTPGPAKGTPTVDGRLAPVDGVPSPRRAPLVGPSGTDEAALVDGLRQRDEQVLAALVDAWTPLMLRVARTYVRDRSVAEEVVQDTWLALLEGIDRFEGRSTLRTWLFHVLANRARTRAVRERRTVPISAVAGQDGTHPTVDPARFQGPGEPLPGHWRQPPGEWSGSPEHQALSGELMAHLGRAVSLLPERQRAVLVLRDVQGFDADETCAALSLTPGNQRVLLHRARAAVRATLDEYLGEQG